ncbi:hypothetical protein ACE1ET_20530 [Saccharicrinis sp. FJH62]|uniref:hypothetical protein n=1 Tax=Saccharicrinis sp. FJH62 TaxID=3344657 RepID=UPI0035D45A03
MTISKLTYLILILVSIASCKTDFITDEKIVSDIFPQLVDSLNIKWRPMPPPPPPPIFDNDSNFIGVDSSKVKEILLEHQKYLDRLDSIDSRIFIGITDTCFFIDWDDLKSRTYSEDDLVSEFISLNEIKTTISKVLNINQINVSSNLKLILKSEINNNYSNIWTILRDRKFAGLLEISRIYRLENNEFGLLQVDYYYDEWDGYSYFLIIEKTDKKWHIKKLLRNWVT